MPFLIASWITIKDSCYSYRKEDVGCNPFPLFPKGQQITHIFLWDCSTISFWERQKFVHHSHRSRPEKKYPIAAFIPYSLNKAQCELRLYRLCYVEITDLSKGFQNIQYYGKDSTCL